MLVNNAFNKIPLKNGTAAINIIKYIAQKWLTTNTYQQLLYDARRKAKFKKVNPNQTTYYIKKN